jgi:hypothetical protein
MALSTSLLLAGTYTVHLGKFVNKSEVDTLIDNVNKNLQNEIEVTYRSPYYHASTKPYPTKEMANVKLFILKQHFPDALLKEPTKVKRHEPTIKATRSSYTKKTTSTQQAKKKLIQPEYKKKYRKLPIGPQKHRTQMQKKSSPYTTKTRTSSKPTLTTDERCHIRLARFKNVKALKKRIALLPQSLQKEIKLHKEDNTVIASTITYPNRSTATAKLPKFKSVFNDAFIQQIQRVTEPKNRNHQERNYVTKAEPKPQGTPNTKNGARVRLARLSNQSVLQEKIATLPLSIRRDVRIFKSDTTFIATTILYPNKTIAQNKLSQFKTVFSDAYITGATRYQSNNVRANYIPSQKEERGFFSKLNPFSSSGTVTKPTRGVEEKETIRQGMESHQTSPIDTSSQKVYYVIRLARYTNKKSLIQNIGKLEHDLRRSVILFPEKTFYVAHSKSYPTKEEALQDLSRYKKVFLDAYVKTIDTSQESLKSPTSSLSPSQKFSSTSLQKQTSDIAPSLNFPNYTYTNIGKTLHSGTQSTASYTIRLGKYRDKTRLQKQVNRLGTLKKKVHINKEGDYHIASSLPYTLKLTAQQELGKFKKVFSDAFIQTHAPLAELPQEKEAFTKTRFHHKDFKGVKNPEELIFKPSKMVLQTYGTSQIHGKVRYRTKTGKRLKLTNRRAYLVEKDKTITEWYNNYYLKNRRSGAKKSTVATYITTTELSLDNSFTFYGVAKGEYCLIVQADYPRNIAKNQHIYLAKMLEVDEFKKLSTTFTKEI